MRPRRAKGVSDNFLREQEQEDIVPVVKKGETITVEEHRLLSREDVPHYQLHNKYVLKGYRSFDYPALRSFFGPMHNETVNIWSHLIGGAIFSALFLVALFTVPYPHVVPMCIFLLSVAICLSSSCNYHLRNCRRFAVFFLLLRVDVFSVTIDVVGTLTILTYCTSYASPFRMYIYFSIIVLIFVVGMFFSFHPMFYGVNNPKAMLLRSFVFLLFAMFGLVPLFHRIFEGGLSAPDVREIAIPYFCGMYVVNFVALVCYALNVPERFLQAGKVDNLTGHAIMHIGVVISPILCALGSSKYIQLYREIYA